MTGPPLILVVGMHRSGTSLLGSILGALGVALPGPLIPGDQHNPAGYFERSDITALQEELLIDLRDGGPANQHCLCLRVGCTQREHSVQAAYRKRLLEQDQRQQHPLGHQRSAQLLLVPLAPGRGGTGSAAAAAACLSRQPRW